MPNILIAGVFRHVPSKAVSRSASSTFAGVKAADNVDCRTNLSVYKADPT
jgi:hypothetical protein